MITPYIEDYIQNKRKRCLSICGAGGKTTLVYYLTKVLTERGRQVVVTTTTKIYAPHRSEVKEIVLCETFSRRLLKSRFPFALGSEISGDKKLLAPSLDCLEKLHKNAANAVILIEADGSKHCPIKAPNENEPIFLKQTDLAIGVIGWDAVGKPIDEKYVHRVDCFLNVTGKKLGDIITVEDVIQLVRSPEGLFRHLELTCPKVLVINKVKPNQLQDVAFLKEALSRELCVEVIEWGKISTPSSCVQDSQEEWAPINYCSK